MASTAQPNTPPAPVGHNSGQRPITDMISDWYVLKNQIAELSAKEVALRREIFDQAFPNAPEKGTVRFDVGYGKELKGVAKLNYTVDRAGLAEAIKGGLDSDVLDKVIKYKPEVSETGLFTIDDPKVKAVLASFITSKPGLPSIEIVDASKRGK